MYIRLYNNILNPLPQHRKAVTDGIEQKLKTLGFKYYNGNQYAQVHCANMVELMKMFSWISALGFTHGVVGWV